MKFKQNVKAGTLLLKEEPFVYILNSKYRGQHCDNCLRHGNGALLKCSACKYVHYCGKVCQKEGWQIHAKECPLMKKISSRVLPDAAHLVSRIILRMKYGGNQVKSFYSEDQFRMFKDLMSHYSDIKDDARRIEHFTSLYAVLDEYMGPQLPNSAEVLGMYGRMQINSFNISDKDLKAVGTGIYLGASIVDHSCDPNAIAVFDGTTIHLRTVKEIESFEWSKVFISYIDVLNMPAIRQEELKKNYYFLCQCPKCLDTKCLEEMSLIICPNKSCSSPISMQNLNSLISISCSKCERKLTCDFISNYKEVMEFIEMQLQNMKELTYLDVCKVCLRKQKDLFHISHIYHVKMLDLAFESSIDFQQFDGAKEYGLTLEEGYLKYYGKYHPIVTLFYLKMAKICLYMECFNEAKIYIRKASEVIKITHGTSMTLFKEDFISLWQQLQN